MIIKVQTWVESTNLTDPSVEKSVIEDLLYASIGQALKISDRGLKDLGDDYWEHTSKFRQLIFHLKNLEGKVVTHKRVLEAMRTGLTDKKG